MKHARIKLLTIVGARPQIIKAAAISRAIRHHYCEDIHEVMVHTGQHYDHNMSRVFFGELDIPEPDHMINLKCSIESEQLAEMEKGIAEILKKEKPDAVLLYGDTNSTYAGARAAKDLSFPVVHVEAGLRSYNSSMPEERNRIYADRAAALLFTPTAAGYTNLLKEGFPEKNLPPFSASNPKIYLCGDVMYDNTLHFAETAERKTAVLNNFSLEKNNYILATIHRNTNTDTAVNLEAIFTALLKISEEANIKIFIPLHPRTKKMTAELLSTALLQQLYAAKNILLTEPVSFLEMTALEKNCKMVMTDSGGVQKEAFYFKKPCVVLRNETEWIELIECGAAVLADPADPKKIFEAFERFNLNAPKSFPPYFGDGSTAEFICSEIIRNFKKY